MTALTWLGDGLMAIVLVLCLPVAILLIGAPLVFLVRLALELMERLS